MATNPSVVRKTCTLRADAPVFVPRERSKRPVAGFRLNPQAAEYKPSKGQQALVQLLGFLMDASISERSKRFDGSAESSGQRSEGPVSVASSPGWTYAASTGCSSSGSNLFDDSTGTAGDGSPRQSPRHGVLHHHHIHHHPRRHLLQAHHSITQHVLPRIEHAEFVGSVEHLEHLEHASRVGRNHAGDVTHLPSSGYMHIQALGATQHFLYRPYPAPGIPVPNHSPIPCEAYLLHHPLRDPRTGYWEVPKAQPVRHRYSEADLAFFRSTHKDYKQAHGIALYGQATNGSQDQGVVNSPGQTMAREYHAQNTHEYRDLESIQKVYGRAQAFWYGWY